MIITIITTVSSKNEAERIAEILLKDRLAACVTIIPATSMYRRKGKIAKEDECVILIKTSKRRYTELMKRLKEIHPYELPEILILKPDALEEYIKRVEESTSERVFVMAPGPGFEPGRARCPRDLKSRAFPGSATPALLTEGPDVNMLYIFNGTEGKKNLEELIFVIR